MASGLFWTSDYTDNLFLTNKSNDIFYHLKDLSNYTCSTGRHTVTSKNELIFIDMDNIYKLTNDDDDDENNVTLIEMQESSWDNVCVYCSRSIDDLLVGMTRENRGKVIRINQYGKTTQTIQHDVTGQDLYNNPGFITENNNGDVLVSDFAYDSDAVVETELSGRHRFSYSGHPLLFMLIRYR